MSFKIPLSPVELPAASITNNAASFTSNGVAVLATANLPKSGPAAFTLSGMPIFPPYNDQGGLAWRACEMDRCNAHVGKGFDYHYHGDPFGYPDRPCMYSAADYNSTDSHPPLIGYSADGFPLSGRYLSENAPGYSVALDACGGHNHGSYGYHYHSQVLQIVEDWTYTAYIAGSLIRLL